MKNGSTDKSTIEVALGSARREIIGRYRVAFFAAKCDKLLRYFCRYHRSLKLTTLLFKQERRARWLLLLGAKTTDGGGKGISPHD
jgi:hypothetical protein